MTKPKRELTSIEEYGTHYSHVTWCGNCGQRNYCYIPKGTERKNCKAIICDKCGCKVEVGP